MAFAARVDEHMARRWLDRTSIKPVKYRERVRELQKKLNAIGYDPGLVDGRMGPRTRAAVKALQKTAGLEATGWPDRKTLAALETARINWKPIQPGVEYAVIDLRPPTEVGDPRLHVVRVDASQARMAPLMVSEHGGEGRTAAEWAKEFGLSVVINLGMYETDYRTHTGYLRRGEHENNPLWVEKYKSVLVMGARKEGLPEADILDLDAPGKKERMKGYDTVVQNLRLIKGEGRNVWTDQARRWTESALAQDTEGRLLFLFTRTPYSMYEFNEMLLGLPLGIV